MRMFSVIVPVYNVEAYLRDCVESVLMQDNSDYELILVDDGSTDNSGALCDELCELARSRDNVGSVKVVHQENGGSSAARNAGIRCSSGKYLLFLDSDDYWIYNDTLSMIDEEIRRSNADMVVFRHEKRALDKNLEFGKKLGSYISGAADLRRMLLNRSYKCAPWDKAVRREIFERHSLLFPVGKIGEDIAYCASLLEYCENIRHIPHSLYAYRMRGTSISHGNRYTRLRARMEALETILAQNYRSEYVPIYVAQEYACLYGEIPKDLSRRDYQRLSEWLPLLLAAKTPRNMLVYAGARCLGYRGLTFLLGK